MPTSVVAARLLDGPPILEAREGRGALGAPEVTPEEIISRIERSGLRGRGGAGYATAAKLRAVVAAVARGGGEPVVVANGYDADRDSPLAATLLERQPRRVLDGIALAARAVGASRAYLYLHPEATATRSSAEAALAAATDLGGLAVEIALGPGGFAGGEESIALAVLESRKAMARQRPPYPARDGLRGRPTLVQSVETLAWLPSIVREGPDGFRASGTAATPGTKLVSVTGAVARPGVYEVGFGTTLGTILDGAGVAAGLKAIQVGGPTGGLLAPARRDVALGYAELAAVGAHLGSAQVRAIPAETCVVAEAGRLFAYLARESCAICVPCRVGTKRVEGIIAGITSGLGRTADLPWLTEIGDQMARFSLCGFGITAPQILRTTMVEFGPEYRAHIDDGRCPTGTCAPTRARRYERMVQP